MIRLSKQQGIAERGKETGFTVPELLVGVIAGTLIIGAASTGLRTSQTLISESHGKETLRQNTTNGLGLMRSEIERSMNILVARTEVGARRRRRYRSHAIQRHYQRLQSLASSCGIQSCLWNQHGRTG